VLQNPGFLSYCPKNWITCSLCHARHTLKISERFVHNFLSYLANTQTNRQTNKHQTNKQTKTGKNITSLAKVTEDKTDNVKSRNRRSRFGAYKINALLYKATELQNCIISGVVPFISVQLSSCTAYTPSDDDTNVANMFVNECWGLKNIRASGCSRRQSRDRRRNFIYAFCKIFIKWHDM